MTITDSVLYMYICIYIFIMFHIIVSSIAQLHDTAGDSVAGMANSVAKN